MPIIPNSERTPEELRANARKGGLEAARRRREKMSVRAALLDILNEKTEGGHTRFEVLAARALQKLFEDPRISDIKTLCEVLGELRGGLSMELPSIKIEVADDTAAAAVRAVLNGDEAHKDGDSNI